MSIKKFGIVSGILFALVVAVTPVIAACDLQNPSECTNEQLVALIQGLLGGGTTTPTTGGIITGIPQGFQFTTNLMQTSTGNDVKYLQILLNSDTATKVAATGAGSPGNETTYFGPATKAAVIKFQNKYASEVLAPYGLTAGTGYFGVSSRTKANALIGAGTTPGTTLPQGCTSTSGFSPITGQPCDSGTTVILPPGCTSTSGFSPVTGQPCSGGTTPVSGAFSVALASTNPASGTLVQGQSIANLLEVVLSNGTSSEVKLTAVELTRLGVSADATLANVYLFDGAVRLTDPGTISSGKVTFNNANGVIVIPANSTKTVSIKSDILAGSQGQTVGVSVSAITASATLSGTLPINGNLHTIANATLATVNLGANTVGGTTVNPANDVKVWESQFAVLTRNVSFTRLSLKQISSIQTEDISNFRLLVDGVQVATASSVDANGYLTFTFEKTLLTGNRMVKVLADITGGSGRTAQFSLRNKADIDVKDSEYNVAVSVGGTVPNTAGALIIGKGSLLITKRTDSPSGTVPNNSTGVVLAKYDFKAYGEPIKIENLKPGFTYVDAGGVANAACSLRNAIIQVNGAQVGSTFTLPEAGPATPVTTNFVIQPGETALVEIIADIYDIDGMSAIESGDIITAKLLQGNANGSKTVSYEVVDVPTAGESPVLANSLQVSEGVLTAFKTTAYASQTTVVPQTTYKLASYDLTGSNTEDINLNTITVTFVTAALVDSTFAANDLSNVYIKYGETTGAIKSTVTASEDWSINYTLPKNGTVRIEVYGNIGTGITNGEGLDTTLLAVGTGASSAATIQSNSNVAVNGQRIIKNAGSISVARDASTPAASLLDDTGSVKTVSYKFEAINDTYVIVEATATISDPSVVSSVKLKDGSTVLATKPGDSTVVFGGIVVPVNANTTKILDIEVDLSSVGYGSGNTGASIITRLTGAKARANASGVISALGAGEGIPAAAGNGLYVYKAVPTMTLSSLPTSTLATGSGVVISKFTVATSGTGTVGWKKLDFTVSKIAGAAKLAISDPILWDMDNNQQVAGTGVVTTLAATDATGSITFIPTTEEQISGSRTYELRVTVTDATGLETNDYINTSIANPGAALGKTASNEAFAYVTAATSYYYYDVSNGGTVNAGDVRQVAQTSITSAYAQTNTGVAGPVGGDTALDEVHSFGAVTTGQTVILTETGAATNAIGAITGTLVSTGGFTCAAYDAANGGGATTTTIASILSVKCTKAGSQVVFNTAALGPDAGVQETTITLTSGTYAANSVVAAADSDVGLPLTTNVNATGSFIWSDVSAQSHSIATTDWTTDYLVKNLPTSTQNLVK